MDLTGFMFGNVNEEGELENDGVLDKDAVAHLSRLGVCGSDLGGLVEGEGSLVESEDGEDGTTSAGQDFSEINEMAEDECVLPTAPMDTTTPPIQSTSSEVFYQKGIDFAQSKTSASEEDYDDDYDDSPMQEATPTVRAETPSTSGSQDLGYFSQSASSSLEMSQPDVTVTASADIKIQPLQSVESPHELPSNEAPSNNLSSITPPIEAQSNNLSSITPPIEAPSNSLSSIAPPIEAQSNNLSSITPPIEAQSNNLSSITPPIEAPSNNLSSITPPIEAPSSNLSSITPPIEAPSSNLSSITPPIEAPSSNLCSITPPIEARSTTAPSDVSPPIAESPNDSQPNQTGGDDGYSDSAIPALIPDNMTIEQLHAKVKELFPGFKPHGILRFSSLLGPGKRSSLPQVWKGAVKPKKRSGQRKGMTLDIDFVPPPEMVMESDEMAFLSSASHPSNSSTSVSSGRGTASKQPSIDPETREWRFGPAKVWYDMLGVPEDGSELNYGFKFKSAATPPTSEDEGNPPSLEGEPPDDAFLMLTQHSWENDILWDVPYTPGPPMSGAGGVWRPLGESSSSLSRQLSSSDATPTSHSPSSMFPIENYELVYSRWEDNVIWDSEAVTTIPAPSLPRIDPNDPNFILGLPEEPHPLPTTDKDARKDGKKPFRSTHLRSGHANESATPPMIGLKKDMFNLSNDEYYNPRHVVSASQGLFGFDSTVVQHSTPALDLHPPWYPPHLGSTALRHFHRPRLRIRCPAHETTTGFYTISDLGKHISKKNKEREKERISSGGGEVFFMRDPSDVSVCDGDVVLAECSEQFPPLVNNIGMASKIKNYYRRHERQMKSQSPGLKYGETAYVQNTSYFLGQLRPGQTLQSFENNLYRTPVYSHSFSPTDFLLIVSGDKVYIRDVEALFLQGQQCPKVEVPAPNSKSSTAFQKDLLQVHLYHLFRENDESPKRIKMDAIRKCFPASSMSESVIRKVLKTCADFKREGYETGGWWVLRSDFRLPSDEELRSLITPEQMCAYHSMLASEARLHEAGYRGRSLFVVEEEEEESNAKIDDELRCAPWNTTHHFINASKGKYHLSVNGPADPTGCGEGFSYTRLSSRRDTSGAAQASKKYKSVMGTDGDLRKLKLSKAKTLLRNFGVPEEEIGKMSRWQVVDRVRELSTKAVKSGGDGLDIKSLKFARGAKFSQMEAQEKYREECQRIFDLQNEVLTSEDILSTDEESSGGESDDELGRDLETLLRGNKTTSQLTREQEEAERLELKRLIMDDKGSREGGSDRGTPIAADLDDTSSVMSYSSGTGRRLIISRTFRDEDGNEFVRDEVVKRQDVIDAYVRLSKDMRSKFIDQDEQTREDMRKEKRKIQDELRRLNNMSKKRVKKPQKPKPLTTINMRCSACGQRGHMKTNRSCPKFNNRSVNVAPTDLELEKHEAALSSQADLVKVEGTKVILNRAVVERVAEFRRKSLLLKFPKDSMRKRRRGAQDEDLDYLETRKSVQRRKTSPEVPFSDHLERILQILIALPESYHFRKPVQQKIVPDYYDVIKFPMDLQTMRDHCRHHVYKSRAAFKEHINLIVTNCVTYNGSTSEVTQHARKMATLCDQEMKNSEKDLEQLEAEINPVLDDNAVVALCYLLGKAVDVMKAIENSWPFHHPVSAKKIPDYHKIIKSPMDLQTMKKNCTGRVYTSVDLFVADLNQIVENSITYNGPSSAFTQTAEQMREAGLKSLEENVEMISQLETRIQESEVLSRSFEGPSSVDDVLYQDLQHSSSSGDSDSSSSDMDI